MKAVGPDINGQPMVMHFVPTATGWAGILCLDGACKFTIEGTKVDRKAMVAFAEQVVREEFHVGKDYHMHLEED